MVLLALSVALSKGHCMTRTELTRQEREALSDVSSFNTAWKNRAWSLHHRMVHELNLGGLELEGAELEDVELSGVNLSGSHVRGSKFTGVDFLGTELVGAQFQDCEFTNCRMEGLVGEKAGFRRCSFRQFVAKEIDFPGAVFQDCLFQTATGHQVTYTDAQLTRTRFENCTLTRCKFYDAMLADVAFNQGSFTDGNFGHIAGGKLFFEGVALKSIQFSAKSYSDMGFAKCTMENITFEEFSGTNTVFIDCKEMWALKLARSRFERLGFSGCKNILEMRFFHSVLRDFSLSGSHASCISLIDSEMSGHSLLESSVVQGCEFIRAKLDGVLLRNVTLGDRLVMKNTSFIRLKLEQIIYEPGINIQTEAVDYSDSDRFAPP
jgi:uncharacterized protein YjbI with pentapeptide repeats